MELLDSKVCMAEWLTARLQTYSASTVNTRFVGAAEEDRKSSLRNSNVLRLLISQRQAIPAQAKFDRISQRRPADDLDTGAIAKAHFQ
jgi:hypothetical protein